VNRLLFFISALFVVGALVSAPSHGWAQADDSLDDELDAPIGGPPPSKERTNPPAGDDFLDDELEGGGGSGKPAAAPAAAAAKVTEEASEESPAAQDRIKAVPRKAVLKMGRLELGAFATFSVNDAFWQHYAASGSVIYYPHDAFGIGLGVDYMYAHARQSNLDVVRQTLTSVPATFEKPRLFAHLDFYWVPIYGKISLFNTQIVHFDFYATAGVGFATSFGSAQPPAVNGGIGQRFFVSDWLALRFEVRSHLFVDTADVEGFERSDVQNYVMAMAGVSFYLPPSFEYTYR